MHIVIQSTFNNIEIGLYKDNQSLGYEKIDKLEASAKLIPVLNDLLIKKNLSLKDISFIVANKGPAPFTTLRVVLATVNGIALATQIPLIGVDALKAYMYELEQIYLNKNILIIFNAFSGDAYFGLKNNRSLSKPSECFDGLSTNGTPPFAQSEPLGESKGMYEFGCMNFDLLLEKIKDIKNLEIFGNGIETLKDKLTLFANENNVNMYPEYQYPSLDTIANFGLEAFKNKEATNKIEPIYLKQAVKN